MKYRFVLVFLIVFSQSNAQVGTNDIVNSATKISLCDFVPQIIRNVSSPDDSSKILLAMYGWNASKRRAEVNVMLSQDSGNSFKLVLQDASTQWISELSCAFGLDGKAYVVTGASKRSGKLRGHTYGEMHVFFSSDGGSTWNGPTKGPFIDWTAATVDVSNSKFKNRLYIFGHDIADSKGGWVGPSKPLIYSDDFGESFSKPLFTGKWPDDGGGYPLAAQANSEGVVFALYRRANPSGWLIASSNNGGKTVDLNPVIAKDTLIDKQNSFDIGFDIDKSKGAFSGRLYIAYSAIKNGIPAALLAYSDDYGETWTHRHVSNYLHNNINQDLGAISLAVNKDGLIGIMWFEPESNCQRFSISRNGGKSFDDPILLSDTSSINIAGSQFFENHLQTMGSYEPDVPKGVPPGSVAEGIGLSIRIIPQVSPNIQISADASGNFHPVWMRQQEDGTFVLFTTTISAILKNNLNKEKNWILDSYKKINDKVVIDVVGQQYDALSGTYKINFSVTNISDSTFIGPALLKVTEIVSGFGFSDPSILNSENGVSGKGAIYDLTNSMIENKLNPGAATKPYEIKFRVNQIKTGEEIWKELKDGLSVHPISSRFEIYVEKILE